MPKNIQIRNVPDEVHRILRTRAAAEGRSLSEYLLRDIKEKAAHPTLDEWLERVRRLPPLKEKVDVAAIIREERDNR